ncbi:hypothetical protein UY3_15512 [Chelonia mydas]|uniref:Uncharacterized protein n=1 Tax=Chelonia mydas TaxID=8469 RepID=M7B5F0_CHEMY|nr:hypothetical protein UY3_15512 [Chelonia mydas]
MDPHDNFGFSPPEQRPPPQEQQLRQGQPPEPEQQPLRLEQEHRLGPQERPGAAAPEQQLPEPAVHIPANFIASFSSIIFDNGGAVAVLMGPAKPGWDHFTWAGLGTGSCECRPDMLLLSPLQFLVEPYSPVDICFISVDIHICRYTFCIRSRLYGLSTMKLPLQVPVAPRSMGGQGGSERCLLPEYQISSSHWPGTATNGSCRGGGCRHKRSVRSLPDCRCV